MPNESTSPQASAIKQARLAAGLTQRQAAALLPISPRTLQDYEQGRHRMPVDRWELLQLRLEGTRAEDLLRQRLSAAARRFSQGLGAISASVPQLPDSPGNGAGDRDSRYADVLHAALDAAQPRPTLEQLAGWTGLGIWALRAWLLPPTSAAHRRMPRYALRLALWELAGRDRIRAEWIVLLQTPS